MSGRTRWGLALAVTAATAAATADQAQAGTYDFRSCWDAAHPGILGWTAEGSGNGALAADNCGAGSTFGGRLGTGEHQPGDHAVLRLDAPSGTRIERITAIKGAKAGPFVSGGDAAGELQRNYESIDSCRRSAGCTTTGEVALDQPLNGASTIQFGAFCLGSVSCPAGDDTYYRLRHVLTTLSDITPPVFTAPPSGSLTDSSSTASTRSLSFAASDVGGGVFRARLFDGATEMKKVVVDANGGACDAAGDFYQPVPCRTASTPGTLDLDTKTLAEGTHSIRFDVRDSTDTNKAEAGPWTVSVDNVPPVIGAVDVTGRAREGDTLTCAGTVTGQGAAPTYAWLRTAPDGSGATVISGATTTTYVLQAADNGRKVLCRVSATDGGGTSTAQSSTTAGPFAGGATVDPYCSGRPTGAVEECGDADGDLLTNREDPDDDNDGVPDTSDPSPFDPKVPAPSGATPTATGPAATPTTPTTPTSPTNTTTPTSTPPAGSPTPPTSTTPGASSTGTITSTGSGPAAAPTDLNTVAGVRDPLAGIQGTNGEPASDEARLSAKLVIGTGVRAKPSLRAIAPYRQRLRVQGTLQTPTGQGIARARIYLAEKPSGAGDSAWKLGASATTDATGAFDLPVASGGRNRDIRVVYFPRGGSSTNRGSNVLVLSVRQDATFTLSRRVLHNGGRLAFDGKVLGLVPRGGVDVRVQVQVGRSWFTFTKLTTSSVRGGRFHATHRFTKTIRAATYRFRVLVLPRNRTVYTKGYSRILAVRVLP
ncbi:MAG: hypothetical protein JWM31_385 [Solirubrobacterales bacterium]|nr:hypothetical protein [Solirubrobacterales bacterium]